MSVIERKENILYFDGCNTLELAKKYMTPLYIMSLSDMKQRMKEIREDFLEAYENTRAAYAGKAFLNLAMCRLVEQEGLCLDVVSEGELYTAIRAGFPAERIEFNGNCKLRREIEMAVDYGVGRIIVDGLQELALIESICKEKSKKANILYRITPGVKADTHDYIVTGKKDSKFGIPLEEDVVYPAVEAALNSEHVSFLGFHFHVGSQLHANDAYLDATKIALNLIDEVHARFDCTVRELNVGGGFGIHYTDRDERKPFRFFLDPVMEQITRHFETAGRPRPTIVIEPGRSIVGEAGISLYEVGSIKKIEGIRTYVSVDGGMSDNIRPALYEAKYDAVIANKAERTAEQQYTISGKCCESGDILIQEIALPAVELGDIIALFSTGAYGYSMANNYNRIPIPAVVWVENGKDELIVKRQELSQIIQNDVSDLTLLS